MTEKFYLLTKRAMGAILPLMVWLFGFWGVASVQGAADILTLCLAFPFDRRVLRDIRRLELAAEKTEEFVEKR